MPTLTEQDLWEVATLRCLATAVRAASTTIASDWWAFVPLPEAMSLGPSKD